MAKGIVLCDTDVLIDYLDNSQKRHQKTKEVLENEIFLSNIIISPITNMELLIGAKNKRELNQISKSLKRFGSLLLNNEISRVSVDLIKKYNLSHGLAIPDSIIAATALVVGIALFTFNKKDYQFIGGLKLYNPESFRD